MCKKDVKQKVFEVVEAATEPIDCEKVAREVHVGWGTALRYALELLVQGKIRGLKTTKSWVFWTGDMDSKNSQVEGKEDNVLVLSQG